MSCKYSLCSAVPCVRWKFSPSSNSNDILLRIIYPGLLPPSDKGFGFNLFISSFLHPSQVICQGNIISLVQSCPTLTNTSYSEPKKKKKYYENLKDFTPSRLDLLRYFHYREFNK